MLYTERGVSAGAPGRVLRLKLLSRLTVFQMLNPAVAMQPTDMPARLILNADDFGLTPGINRAIAELHEAGALTSATLMAKGPAFRDAVAIGRQHPRLGVGCHVVLTDGEPVSPPERIRSLLGPDGKTFRPSLLDFLSAVLLGKVAEEEIAEEAMAQIRQLQDAGIAVTHLDTHKHTHILPQIARPLLLAAKGAGIRAMRNPFEGSWSLAESTGNLERTLQVRLMRFLQPRFRALPAIRTGRVITTDGTVGISATGHLDAAMLRSLLAAMPEGTWEIVCHPGYNDRDLDSVTTRLRASREVERDALLSVLAAAKASPEARTSHPSHPPLPSLIHYGDLSASETLPLQTFPARTG